MIEIAVCRNSSTIGMCSEDDPNLNWGADISDPLLTTESAANERGRVEIDSVYSNRNNVSIKLTSKDFIQPGQLIEVEDGINISKGLLTAITLKQVATKEKTNVETNLNLECPA